MMMTQLTQIQLLPVLCQAISWTNAGILSISTVITNGLVL